METPESTGVLPSPESTTCSLPPNQQLPALPGRRCVLPFPGSFVELLACAPFPRQLQSDISRSLDILGS